MSRSNVLVVLLALGAVVVSCGDDDGGTPDSGGGTDAGGGTDSGPGEMDSGAGPEDAGGGEDVPAAGDTWSSFAMGFFATYCVECHQTDAPGRRDYRTIDHVRRDMARVRCGVAPESMPASGCVSPPAGMFPVGDGPFPSDMERQRIVAFIDDGLPE